MNQKTDQIKKLERKLKNKDLTDAMRESIKEKVELLKGNKTVLK